MFTKKKNTFILILSIIIVVFVVNTSLGVFLQKSKTASKNALLDVTPTAEVSQKVTYKGSEGKNALELLQENAQVKQDNSGLVVSINNREASEKDREYWSFYVNGKLSNVGPKDYMTKDIDLIEWKIETY